MNFYKFSKVFLKKKIISNLYSSEEKLLIKHPPISFEDHYPVMWRNILDLIETNVYSESDKFTDKNTKENLSTFKAIGDMTIGCGNHTKLILDRFQDSVVVGVDCDEKMIDYSSEKLKKYIDDKRLVIIEDSYVCVDELDLSQIFEQNKIFNSKKRFDFILADLGYNSKQLEDPEKGISFKDRDAELDMRYDTSNDNKARASDILNNSSQLELYEIFKVYGDEKYYQVLVTNIIAHRDTKFFSKVGDFLDVIDKTFRDKAVEKFNTYTRLFQALRIAANYEYLNVQRFVGKACRSIEIGGIIAIITFHSGEDKIVKNIFSEMQRINLGKNIYNYTLKPEEFEIQENSRSKSAILRAFKFNPKI